MAAEEKLISSLYHRNVIRRRKIYDKKCLWRAGGGEKRHYSREQNWISFITWIEIQVSDLANNKLKTETFPAESESEPRATDEKDAVAHVGPAVKISLFPISLLLLSTPNNRDWFEFLHPPFISIHSLVSW